MSLTWCLFLHVCSGEISCTKKKWMIHKHHAVAIAHSNLFFRFFHSRTWVTIIDHSFFKLLKIKNVQFAHEYANFLCTCTKKQARRTNFMALAWCHFLHVRSICSTYLYHVTSIVDSDWSGYILSLITTLIIPQIDICLYSHYLSGWYCIDIVCQIMHWKFEEKLHNGHFCN